MNQYKYYDIIVGIFVAVLLVTQTVAQKIASFGPFDLSAGVILFPISYIFGDVLTEVYGYQRARRVIWIGFAAAIMMAATYWTAVLLPPADGWNNQAAFASVLNMVPRIVAASVVAYWVGSFANAYIMAKMKVVTRGHHLWARTISSTIVGEGLDTIVVMVIAFAGVLPSALLWSVGVSIYVAKVAYEIVATPLTYLVVNALKRAEGMEVYDTGTSFSPFALRVDEPSEKRTYGA